MSGAGDHLSWRELAARAELALDAIGIDTAASDARWIVVEASGLEGAEWHLGADAPATSLGVSGVERMLARRVAGEPLQYVLGCWSFRTVELFVDRRVLIPRPETEEVVGHAIEALDRRHRALRERGDDRRLRVVDLGTGSGAIALAIAAERDWTEVWATDRSSEALEVARANLAGIGRHATRVALAKGSWFEALPAELRGTLDLVVSNPPYVAEAEAAVLDESVRAWEPVEALVPGPTGLEAIEHLVGEAPRWLADGGTLVVEIGAAQGSDAAALAIEAGFEAVEVRPDLPGRDRTLLAR